ncbi:MAG: hypothetical protein AB1635_18075 [Acidobacteriota bacterium]
MTLRVSTSLTLLLLTFAIAFVPATPSESSAPVRLSGDALFRGIFLGRGPAADMLPEI